MPKQKGTLKRIGNKLVREIPAQQIEIGERRARGLLEQAKAERDRLERSIADLDAEIAELESVLPNE